jgi:hypothetical protein
MFEPAKTTFLLVSAEPVTTSALVRSAKGAVRTARGLRNCLAPHSVLRVFLKSDPVAPGW